MKILVVDRVKLFQQIIASVLQETEIVPVFAANGADAVQMLQQDYFDIICISMFLDDMDAQDLCRRVRKLERYAYTPVILLTSEDAGDVMRDALRSGITDVFSKQNCDQLVNFVRRIVRQERKLQGRILFVEDTLSQRLLLAEMFKRRGLLVDAFSNGEEAWAMFGQHDYDLVITDIVLDGSMSGVTLANRIRRLEGSKGDVPILAITAFDNISRRIGLFHLGIDDYVIKPVVEEELFARVKGLIENRRFVLRLQKERDKVAKANAAQSEFLAWMSQELLYPLEVMLAQTRNLKSWGDEKIAFGLAGVEQVNQHVLGMVREMADISAIEAGRSEAEIGEVDVVDLLEQAVNAVRHAAAHKSIVIHGAYQQEACLLRINEAYLKQVLQNLLSNAVKYNREGGEVFVSLRQEPEQGGVAISIRDTGPGAEEDVYNGILNSGNLMESIGQGADGSGLGLFVAKKMLEQMGGNLKVKSKTGKGTLFTLTLPLSK